MRSSSFHVPLLMSHRLAPQTSLMSMGATLPRKMEARKDETSEMRAVALYASGYFSWKRWIWGPLNLYCPKYQHLTKLIV